IYPYARLVDGDGNALAYPKDYRNSVINGFDDPNLLDWNYRPLDEFAYKNNTAQENYIRLNTSLQYTFLPGLNAQLRYQLEQQVSRNRDHRSQDSYFTRNLINLYSQPTEAGNFERPIPLGGILDQSRTE